MIVLSYGLVLAVGSPAGFPTTLHTGRSMPYLADKPLQEDAFYMLSVAWNVGRGAGFTYNHDQATVGVQPLSVVLDGAMAWAVRRAGGDRWTLARAVLLTGLLNFLIFSAVAGAIAGKLPAKTDPRVAAEAASVAAVLVLADFSLFRQFTNGLETGIYTIFAGCCIWLSLAHSQRRRAPRDALLLGIAAGLAALARLDFLVVFAAYLAVAGARRTLTITDAVVAGTVCLAVLSPWLLHVHRLTGQWIPSSGLAQAAYPTVPELLARAGFMAIAAVQGVSPWLHLEPARIALTARLMPEWGLAVAVVLALTLAVVAAMVVRPAARNIEPTTRRVMTTWAAAFGVLFLVYPTFFFATYFYPRYATPFVAVGIPLLAVGLAGRRRWLGAGIAALMPVSFAASAALTLHNGSLGNANLLMAAYVSRWMPAARVGAFQSGVVGYFNANVVNLDGKINADALVAGRAGTLPQYIERQQIRFLVDWPSIIAEQLPAGYLERTWAPCKWPAPADQFACLERR